jgi:hypothetical protein
MDPWGRIDREKHEVDITEHVLEGGVRTEVGARAGDRGLARAPWPLAIVASAVQVQRLGEEPALTKRSDRPRREDDRKR